MWTNNLRSMGRINKLLSISFLVFMVFISCQSPNEKIKKAVIKYLPEETTIMVAVTCESMDYVTGGTLQKSKTIIDRTFLENLNEELDKLKPEQQEKSIDIRIKLIIEYENRSDTLCLGEFFDTVLNGELMEDNPRLLDFIKSKIY